LCLPRLGDLIQVLFLSGPLVASAIFPVVFGLYWRQPGQVAAVLAMLAGSLTGLVAYYQIGWFVASLVSVTVSLVVMVVFALALPRNFQWATLNEAAAPLAPTAKAG
ncbi:MAG: urea transporter, partial [Verrucomicrobiota bacterium]